MGTSTWSTCVRNQPSATGSKVIMHLDVASLPECITPLRSRNGDHVLLRATNGVITRTHDAWHPVPPLERWSPARGAHLSATPIRGGENHALMCDPVPSFGPSSVSRSTACPRKTSAGRAPDPLRPADPSIAIGPSSRPLVAHHPSPPLPLRPTLGPASAPSWPGVLAVQQLQTPVRAPGPDLQHDPAQQIRQIQRLVIAQGLGDKGFLGVKLREDP